MAIRLAEEKDLSEILKIYEYARKFMAENGNPHQWGSNNPAVEVLEADIAKKQLYVCMEKEMIYGVFAWIIGDDPTYARIDEGAWKSDTLYGTIHRLAGNGTRKGVFEECLEYCRKQCSHIRVDTHTDNYIMQHGIEKNGFERCGIIYVSDGTPRIAYEREN